MESRKRRTARSRSFSREREEYSDLDIPISRGEEQRRTGEKGNGRADTYEEEAYHHPRRQRGSESKRGKRKKSNLLKGALFLVLFLCGIFFLWRFISPYIGSQYRTIAIFGLDSRDGTKEAGALSDVIMLATINKRSGEIKLCSVYRDTYAEINGNGKYHKMNEAYFLGGHEQAIAA